MPNDTTHDQRSRPDDRIMQGVIPYLSLPPGQAGAAADFYIKAFGARDMGRMPMEDKPGRFMHIQLEINGGALMLTDHADMPGGVTGTEGPMLRGHLQLVVPDGQIWWDRAIAAGCTEVAPFEMQFWGDVWGLVVDPFAIHWAVLTPGTEHRHKAE